MMKHSHVRCEFGYGIIIPLVKDKHDDLSSSDNYRVITVSPVISKVFELCFLHKFNSFLYIVMLFSWDLRKTLAVVLVFSCYRIYQIILRLERVLCSLLQWMPVKRLIA